MNSNHTSALLTLYFFTEKTPTITNTCHFAALTLILHVCYSVCELNEFMHRNTVSVNICISNIFITVTRCILTQLSNLSTAPQPFLCQVNVNQNLSVHHTASSPLRCNSETTMQNLFTGQYISQ